MEREKKTESERERSGGGGRRALNQRNLIG